MAFWSFIFLLQISNLKPQHICIEFLHKRFPWTVIFFFVNGCYNWTVISTEILVSLNSVTRFWSAISSLHFLEIEILIRFVPKFVFPSFLLWLVRIPNFRTEWDTIEGEWNWQPINLRSFGKLFELIFSSLGFDNVW